MREGLIYLDNAATSWPKPPGVARAMGEFLALHAGNPGRGGHRLAREAGEVIESARSALAGMINAPCAKRVVLTHGCTDAVNLAVHGVLRAALRGCTNRPHAVATAVEHNAVLRTLHCYEVDHLIDVTVVGCDGLGRVDPAEVGGACRESTVLVCVSHASNAAGTVQDVGGISEAVRGAAPGALLLVDAAQTLGHLSVDVRGDGIDLLAVAGHKGLRGPTGTGALYVSERAYPDDWRGARVFCQRRGGTGMLGVGLEMPTELPDALEAGTANAVGFAGLLAALEAHDAGGHAREMAMAGRLLEGLASIEGVRVYGPAGTEGRTPVVMFTIEGWGAREAMDELDGARGICVRGGVHCAPLLHRALGTGEGGAVRASPGVETSEAEIDALLAGVAVMAGRRSRVGGGAAPAPRGGVA